MIDYEEIVENLKDDDVFNLLEQLGAQPIDKGNYFLCRTICHNEDPDEASQKLYYYKDTHLFYCYTECSALSIFKFLKNYYETRQIEYDWYKDILEVILKCSINPTNSNSYKSIRDDYIKQGTYKKLQTYPEGILDCFVKKYPIEWLKDNISPAAMDAYNIRYSITQNKIIIPHYDVNGKLIGIRGRALNPQEVENFGKYMPVQIENKWYSHPLSLNLYGLDHNKSSIKKYGYAFLFESEKSVLQLFSFNVPQVGVAVCGSNFNKLQLGLLMKECSPKEIIICFDNEEKDGEDKYFQKLYNICSRYKNYCNMSFVYDRSNLTQKKSSPTDEGEEKFLKLINERVKI